jgi:hypothetical protein
VNPRDWDDLIAEQIAASADLDARLEAAWAFTRAAAQWGVPSTIVLGRTGATVRVLASDRPFAPVRRLSGGLLRA